MLRENDSKVDSVLLAIEESDLTQRHLSEGSVAVLRAVTKRMPNCEGTIKETLIAIKREFDAGKISVSDKYLLKDQLLNSQPYSRKIFKKLSPEGRTILTKELNSRYTVGICGIHCEDDFPLRSVSVSCRHEKSFCQPCIAKYIGVKMNSRSSAKEIICPQPQCNAQILPEEILAHVKDDSILRDRVDRFLLRESLRKDPSFKDCAKEGCLSGGFCESWATYFECMECSSKTCIRHGVLWHAGVSCEEYDISLRRLPGDSGIVEFSMSQDAMEKITQICPGCGVRIERSEGCSAMTHCMYGDDLCLKRRKAGGCDHGGGHYW